MKAIKRAVASLLGAGLLTIGMASANVDTCVFNQVSGDQEIRACGTVGVDDV